MTHTTVPSASPRLLLLADHQERDASDPLPDADTTGRRYGVGLYDIDAALASFTGWQPDAFRDHVRTHSDPIDRVYGPSEGAALERARHHASFLGAAAVEDLDPVLGVFEAQGRPRKTVYVAALNANGQAEVLRVHIATDRDDPDGRYVREVVTGAGYAATPLVVFDASRFFSPDCYDVDDRAVMGDSGDDSAEA